MTTATPTIEAIILPTGVSAFRVASGLIFARPEAAERFAARLVAKAQRIVAKVAEKVRGTLAKVIAPIVERAAQAGASIKAVAVAEFRQNDNLHRKTWSVRVVRGDGSTTDWTRIPGWLVRHSRLVGVYQMNGTRYPVA